MTEKNNIKKALDLLQSCRDPSLPENWDEEDEVKKGTTAKELASTSGKQEKYIKKNSAYHVAWGNLEQGKKKSECPICSYCNSENTVKRGKRKKKHEVVQLYKCNDCGRTFTLKNAKGKHYPIPVILDGLSYYHIGYGLEDCCRLLEKEYEFQVSPATLSNWVNQYKDICTYNRIRRFGKKLYSPQEIIAGISLYHRQIYKFRIHRAKLNLLLKEDVRHYKFEPLKNFLDAVFQECPHYLFKQGQRVSECKVKFDLNQVLIHQKYNYANRLAEFALQAVNQNKLRHEAVQQFLLCNDSATVASEVPVYLLPEDIEHMENKLKFKIPIKIESVLSGHIDLIQVRNNAIHIMDYKPNAAKEKPITQLTLYALAMSRLTGLRLYDMKCSWFDEKDYFEFFPLHVVYKLREHQRKNPIEQKRLIKAEDL